MSEEEIIYILENRHILIDTLYECYIQRVVKDFDKAINGMINLYENEKEKNKELETNYDKLTIHFQQNHISKDKIKAKIEDLNKRIENLKQMQSQDNIGRTIGIEDCQEKIELYRELLEE